MTRDTHPFQLAKWIAVSPRDVVLPIAARAVLRVLPMALFDLSSPRALRLEPNVGPLDLFHALSVGVVSSRVELPQSILDAALASIEALKAKEARIAGLSEVMAFLSTVATRDVEEFKSKALRAAEPAVDVEEAIVYFGQKRQYREPSVNRSIESASVWKIAQQFGALQWGALQEDVIEADRGIDPFTLSLWPQNDPMQFFWVESKARYLSAQHPPNGEWQFWLDWYEQMLDPAANPPDWPLLEQVALIAPAIWDAGPEAVSAAIDEIQKGLADNERADLNAAELISAQRLMHAALSDFTFDQAARLMRMVPFAEDIKTLSDPDRLARFLADAEDSLGDIEIICHALRQEAGAMQGAALVAGHLDALMRELSKARQITQLNIGKIVKCGEFLDAARLDDSTRKEFGPLYSRQLDQISDGLLALARSYFSETLMRFAPLEDLALEPGTSAWEYLNELRHALRDLSDNKFELGLPAEDIAVLKSLAEEAERAMARAAGVEGPAGASLQREVNYRLALLTVTLSHFGVRRSVALGKTISIAKGTIDWLLRVKGLKEFWDFCKDFLFQ